MKLFSSARCMDYEIPGHPESPGRLRMIHEALTAHGFSWQEPQSASEEQVVLAHSSEHLESVRHENFLDADTPPFPGILSFALLSAGAAIDAAETALNTETAFALTRPPGHHATAERVMGFCYLNNIAIAIAAAQKARSGLKAAVLDIDCHHGNGTEAIFHRRENTLFISLHQSPLYPGSGLTSIDNTLNFPLAPGTERTAYLNVLSQACQVITEYKPDLLGVSVGFDTFAGDPLTAMMLEVEDYHTMGEMIASLQVPCFSVLEGGYHSRLGDCAIAYIEGQA